MLPLGYISEKTIYGKVRYYRQWTENGKLKSEYIPEKDYEDVKHAIDQRRNLQDELKKLKKQVPQQATTQTVYSNYETNVMLGDALRSGCKQVQKYQKRDCFEQLDDYLYKDSYGKVCAVYGLRRTGKTTMLFQAMSELPISQTVYIKAMITDTMASLNRDLKKLAANGYKYIFLDEVTLLEDFIDSAALFSDIYAMQGIN